MVENRAFLGDDDGDDDVLFVVSVIAFPWREGIKTDLGGIDADLGGIDIDLGGIDVDLGGIDVDFGGIDVAFRSLKFSFTIPSSCL